MATKGREKKKEGKDEDEGVADVDDTAVSNLRLDFDSGQRILSKVHLLCQNFRAAAQKAIISVKKDEYDIAKQEVLKAQMKIDQARIDQIEKITTESQRTLTALERARLQQLQDMQNNDKKAADEKSKENKLVSTPFEELLNEHAQENPFSGVDVEQVVEMIVTPFCQDLCTEIDKLYSVNQKMMKLAATCRKETHKQEQKIQDLEARLLRMKRQAKQDSVDLTRLQAGMQLRDTQLKHIRDAYEKEVISVKIQAANAVTAATTASDIKNKESKSYEPGLLPDKIGLDASGQDLDGFVQSYTAQLREKLAMIPQEPPGGVQFAKGGNKIENETFDLQVLLMKTENELAQQQIKNMVLRHGLESYRKKVDEWTR